VSITTTGDKLSRSVLSPIEIYLKEWNKTSDAIFPIIDQMNISHLLAFVS